MATLEGGPVYKTSYNLGQTYGFTPLTQIVNRVHISRTTLPATLPKKIDDDAEELAYLLSAVRDAQVPLEPGRSLLFSHTDMRPGGTAAKNSSITFCALGAPRAIADVVLIRTALSFMNDLTGEAPVVRVNSIGDRESLARYDRELQKFFRQNAGLYGADIAEIARKDSVRAASLLIGSGSELELPRSTDYLSEQSRKLFESVLDLLEKTDTPYELSHTLIRPDPLWSETCFSLSSSDKQVEISGSRFSDFTKHFFKNISLPSMSAIARIAFTKRHNLPMVRGSQAIKFVFVHIGDKAKQVSIKLADALHQARLPLTQFLALESLTAQMEHVERLKPRYVVLLGEKEVGEGYATLRRMSDYSEQQVPLDKLVARLTALAK